MNKYKILALVVYAVVVFIFIIGIKAGIYTDRFTYACPISFVMFTVMVIGYVFEERGGRSDEE